MKIIDYKIKSNLMSSGLYSLYKDYRKSLYSWFKKGKHDLKEIEKSITGHSKIKTYNELAYFVLKDFKQLYNNGNIELFVECAKLYNADSQRRNRLKSRVNSMLSKTCLFLTMTFSDDYLLKTNENTRRTEIRRFLKQFNAPYVANKDFGTNRAYLDRKGELRVATEREHYHGLIQLDNIDCKLYKFGRFNVEKVFIDENKICAKKIASYIAKLTNHAVKETAKRSVLIYSREKSA